MSEAEIPEWLTLLGTLAREGGVLIAEAWSVTVAPLLAAAPAWLIGLIVLLLGLGWVAKK